MNELPACRPCVVDREPKRAPNRARFLTVFIDGMVTLTCERHATMAARAGGFALELVVVEAVLYEPLSTSQLFDLLRSAHVARERSHVDVGGWDQPSSTRSALSSLGASVHCSEPG